MMGTQTDEQACEMLAAKGKIVALKRGSRGCDIYEGTKVHHADAFMIQEVDPDRKSTRLNSSHSQQSRMPSSA